VIGSRALSGGDGAKLRGRAVVADVEEVLGCADERDVVEGLVDLG